MCWCRRRAENRRLHIYHRSVHFLRLLSFCFTPGQQHALEQPPRERKREGEGRRPDRRPNLHFRHCRGVMLDTTRTTGARELSLTTPKPVCAALSPTSSTSAAATILHGSPVESEGTEFFDAYDTLPWSPERAVPARQSPAAVAAKRMQLALWPETAADELADKPHDEWITAINSSTIATSSGPLSADVEEPKVGARGRRCGCC